MHLPRPLTLPFVRLRAPDLNAICVNVMGPLEPSNAFRDLPKLPPESPSAFLNLPKLSKPSKAFQNLEGTLEPVRAVESRLLET